METLKISLMADFFLNWSASDRPVFLYGTFIRILLSQTDNCAPRTISFLLFHSFFIVHRSVLTAGNLIKVKAQQSFKKIHL